MKIVEPHAFEIELHSSNALMLVAFLKRNEGFSLQSQALEQVLRRHPSRVRGFLFDADYLDAAMQRYMIKGTPTFLLFSGGHEVDRLIGASDSDTLEDFIEHALSDQSF